MIERKRELAMIGVLLGALIAARAEAEPPGGPAKHEAVPHGVGLGKPAHADEHAAPGEPGRPGDKPKDHDAKRGDDPAAHGDGAKHGNAAGGRPSEMRKLRDQLKAGTLKKEDLPAQLSKLHDTNKARLDSHRAALKARWGEQLSKPTALHELAVHERRMAKLNRALLLAQTERKGPALEQLTERIEKLIALETARHERRMTQIAADKPGDAPAPAPAASASAGEGVK